MAAHDALAHISKIMFSIGSVALLAVMIVMNTVIIVAVTRNKPLQDARNHFMCSIAISNIALVLTNGARVAMRSLPIDANMSFYLCKVSSIALWWSMYSYVGSLSLVTTEQFLAV